MKKERDVQKQSLLREVFGKDEMGRGRFDVLMSSVTAMIFNAFITGTFYTGFLLALGIDIVNIGIVSSIVLITSFFNIFSPMILNRFPKRKKLLIITRILYHVFNILAVTFLPFLPLSVDGKIVVLCICVFISGTISNVTAPAYSTWHISYVPDDQMRAKFFSLEMIINGVVSAIVVLVSGQLANIVAKTGNEVMFIVILRLVGFVIGMIEVYYLTHPKEPEYYASEKSTSMLAIFRDPFRYPIFLLTVLICFVWNFSSYLTSSAFSAYVLGTLEISYGTITFIDALYSLFLLTLVPLWQKYLAKHSFVKMLFWNLFAYVPILWISLFFTHDNAHILFPLLRILQHVNGTGLNLAFASLPFMNLPEKDRTTCLSFYSLVANVFALAGQAAGTAFIAATSDRIFSLFGFLHIDHIQMLLFMQGIVVLGIVVYIFFIRKKLEPEKQTA